MKFVVGYAPTDTQALGKKHAFWIALDRVVEEVHKHGKPLALVDANYYYTVTVLIPY